MAGQKIDSLISSLSDDLGEVKKTTHPLMYMVPWIAIASFFAVLVVKDVVGIRNDVLIKLHEPTFLFDIMIIGALGIFAAISSAYLMVPDMRGKKWLIPVTFTIAIIFVLWTLVKILTEGLHMPQFMIDHCMEEGLFMAFIPMTALIFFVRGGATTHPYLMALMNVFSSASIAYIGLRFTCPMDTVGHSTVMHLVPYITVGALLGFGARRLYKW